MKIFKTLICCSLALSAQFAFAQDNTDSASIEAPQEMERIEVKGKKPKLFYLAMFLLTVVEH